MWCNLLGSLPIANSLGQRVQKKNRTDAKTESRGRSFIRMSIWLDIVAEELIFRSIWLGYWKGRLLERTAS